MKHLLVILALIAISFVSMAQSKQQTIVLTNGLTVTGTVERTADGFYVVKTPEGDEFFFSANEIGTISTPGTRNHVTEINRIPKNVRENMSYFEIKEIYKASDYKRRPGDELSVGGLATAAFFLPFVGYKKVEYVIGHIFTDLVRAEFLATTVVGFACGAPEYSLIGIGGYFLVGIIDSSVVAHRAKIFNQYYQDLNALKKRGLSLSVDPFVSMTPNTVFASSQPVAGLSLKFSF